ncbi:hypothetical protein [uncultured Brachyspira sp.]|uniref:hypothetical protein n=1 Tax=uncultured Brachyspira sp. TaxID=221953 RepID=UPI00262E0157|nr:hypothetical protein [uncultured Brachyspira sp.]
MFSLRRRLEKNDLETLDIFTISFSLFRVNFINFIIVGLICGMPLILTTIHFPPAVFDPNKVQTIEGLVNWFKNEVNAGFYINTALSIILDTISVIAISLLVEGLIYRKRKTASWAIIKSFKLIIPTLATLFIFSILIFFGLAFFIIPAIILAVLFMFIQNICALRHTWGIDALKYSYNLVKYNFFKALFILSFIFMFKIVFLITFPSAPIDTKEGILYYFLSSISLYIFDTYFKIIIALFFLNRDFVNNAQIEEDDEDEEEENN